MDLIDKIIEMYVLRFNLNLNTSKLLQLNKTGIWMKCDWNVLLKMGQCMLKAKAISSGTLSKRQQVRVLILLAWVWFSSALVIGLKLFKLHKKLHKIIQFKLVLLVAGQKPATSIFNRFSEITWEEKLLLEKNKFKCLEHITIAFV